MNDDELIDRLRRTLREEATQVHAPPDGWERFQRRAAGASPARSRWVVAAPVAALGLAAAIVAAVLVTSNGTSTTKGRLDRREGPDPDRDHALATAGRLVTSHDGHLPRGSRSSMSTS